MGIKPVDFIGEKKGALGSHALMKKGLRRKKGGHHQLARQLGSHALMKKGLRPFS